MGKAQTRLGLLGLGILVLALVAAPAFRPVRRLEPAEDRPDPRRLLEQVLQDVLTNPVREGSREFYGTPGSRRVALVQESPAAWPKDWRPAVAGYDIQLRSVQTPVEDFIYWKLPYGPWIAGRMHRAWPRLLGIRFNTLHLQPDRKYDDQIGVSLYNVGGSGGEGVAIGGGCIVYYTVARREGQWCAQFESSFDP